MELINALPKQINLGNQGESGITTIDVDCTAWLTDFPTGTFAVTFIPPDQYRSKLLPATQAYLLPDGTTLRIIVKRNMTQYSGKGSLVIRLAVGDDTEKRSAVSGTYVVPGHDTATDEMPADIEDWATEATQKLAEIMARMGFIPKGPYNPANENKHGEWYTHEGGSYGYIWPEPSTGVPLTDTTHWQQIASQGTKGDDGGTWTKAEDIPLETGGTVGDKLAEFNGQFDPIINICEASAGTLVRFDTYAAPAVTYADNNDGFTVVEGQSANYGYGFVFDTEIGETYKISLDVDTGSSARIRVGANFKYPLPPDGDSDLYVLLLLSNYGDGVGHYEGSFVATHAQSVLNVRQPYNVSTLSVSGIMCANNGAIPTLKQFAVPRIPEDKLPVANDIHRMFDICSPHAYAIKDAGDFWLYYDGIINTDLQLDDFGAYSTWANIIKISGIKKKFQLLTTGTNVVDLNPVFTPNTKSKRMNNFSYLIKMRGMPSNPSTPLNVLFLGDSLIAHGTYTQHFRSVLSGLGITGINLIGRANTDGDATSKWEATGGYAWPNYVDDPASLPAGYPHNYFWNPSTGELDISYYVNTYCSGLAPDYIISNIGWNQMVNSNYYNSAAAAEYPTFSNYIAAIGVKVRAFLDAVHTEYPSCRIILNGMHYGNPNVYHPTMLYRTFFMRLNALYHSISMETAYSSFVRYCDIAPYFDGETGLSTATRVKNQWTEDTEIYNTDYIHPSDVGYKMHAFADAMCFLYDLKIQQE